LDSIFGYCGELNIMAMMVERHLGTAGAYYFFFMVLRELMLDM